LQFERGGDLICITDSSRISPPLLSFPAVTDGVARNDSSISLDSQATGLSRRCGRDDGAAPSPKDFTLCSLFLADLQLGSWNLPWKKQRERSGEIRVFNTKTLHVIHGCALSYLDLSKR